MSTDRLPDHETVPNGPEQPKPPIDPAPDQPSRVVGEAPGDSAPIVPPTLRDGKSLLSHHRDLLDQSGISPEVAHARGYYSETVKSELKRLGFAPSQGDVPALVIPVWDIDGEVAVFQIRPDRPRRNSEGKELKYEFPRGSKLSIDVPPGIRKSLDDPAIPLYITEGVRKADSAVSKGLCCISLSGVWGWKNRESFWDKLPLEAREVFIVFDSDLKTNENVGKAAAGLAHLLKGRKAEVKLIALPPGPANEKVGLDDYLASRGGTEGLAEFVTEAPAHPLGDDPEYEYTDSGLLRLTRTKDGIERTPLTNFGARIAAELTLTDGARSHKEFRIRAVVAGEAREINIKAEEFEPMKWPTTYLGSKAIVKAGPITRDRTREAIQAVSTDVEQITVFEHTGFVQDGDEWYFLHADGAIGAGPGPKGAPTNQDGPIPKPKTSNELEADGPMGPVPGRSQLPRKIEVRLPSALAGFRLPEPPSGQELIDAVRASLRFLEFPDALVTYPLYALTWVGPLGIGNFTVHLDGTTGKNKSVRAGLIQQHYGAGMNWERLPCAWSATPIALEGTAFQCKDSVLCVDDWLLQGSRSDHEQAQRSAAYLIRATANQAGRQRSNRDGTPNVGRAPRSPILMTGEATPDGHSINARLIRLMVMSDLLDYRTKPLLDQCQADADAGLYAKAMAGYIQYVAGRYEQLRRETAERVEDFRERYRTERKRLHPRTATILAKLMAGFEVFLEFAIGCGAIDEDEFQKLFHRMGGALIDLSRQHEQHLESTDPWDQFVHCLSASLLSGDAHLENRLGGPPISDPRAWGWREDKFTVRKEVPKATGGHASDRDGERQEGNDTEYEYEDKIVWRPQGKCVGWIYDDTIYLIPEPSLGAAQLVANRVGVHLPLTVKTLGKTAYERKKLIISEYVSRGKYTHRSTIETARKRVPVYVMDADIILSQWFTSTAFDDIDVHNIQVEIDRMLGDSATDEERETFERKATRETLEA